MERRERRRKMKRKNRHMSKIKKREFCRNQGVLWGNILKREIKLTTNKRGAKNTHEGTRFSSPYRSKLKWMAHSHVSITNWAHALPFRHNPGPKSSIGWAQQSIEAVDQWVRLKHNPVKKLNLWVYSFSYKHILKRHIRLRPTTNRIAKYTLTLRFALTFEKMKNCSKI